MFSCCFWWFLLGALVGWLLNWLLCRLFKCCGKKSCDHGHTEHTTSSAVDTTKEITPTVSENVSSTVNKPVTTATALKSFILDTTAAKAAGFKLKNPNDLTVIEGVGPKINALFNNAGVYTFEAVSKMSEAEMQKILDDAGPKFRLAKPGTWAKQAELAAENKWAELKTLQDNLTGGV
jgi:predicted flap endonuclease-1-like 5' DNA nuclease